MTSFDLLIITNPIPTCLPPPQTEEVVTKKKTELTTTKQIETRVKRQIVLEDGKVVEDSGPMVSTNTTEDVEKQETNTTEVSNYNIHKNRTI